MAYRCRICGGGWNDGCKCHEKHDRIWEVVCDRRGCDKPACGKTIYGLGYLVSVCQEHYDSATAEERINADRFRYAE